METSTIIQVLWEHGAALTDVASEYGEPGYHSEGPVLLGDYWCHRRDCNYPETYDDGTKKVHELAYHYPRIFAALEMSGAGFEWYDEWTVVDDKAYRTAADSYSWQPTAVFNEDIGEYMVPDDDITLWVDWAVNNPRRCLMRDTFTDAELAEYGFVERECDYESGWYGREDNPQSIMDAIQSRENVDVLFKLSAAELFRITFCVFVRERGTDDEG